MQTPSSLPRRKIRYWLFRFQTEATVEDAPATGAPEGLREFYEEQEWFGGWADFSVKWDISEDQSHRIVPLRASLVSTWDEEAYAEARELPGTPDG